MDEKLFESQWSQHCQLLNCIVQNNGWHSYKKTTNHVTHADAPFTAIKNLKDVVNTRRSLVHEGQGRPCRFNGLFKCKLIRDWLLRVLCNGLCCASRRFILTLFYRHLVLDRLTKMEMKKKNGFTQLFGQLLRAPSRLKRFIVAGTSLE